MVASVPAAGRWEGYSHVVLRGRDLKQAVLALRGRPAGNVRGLRLDSVKGLAAWWGRLPGPAQVRVAFRESEVNDYCRLPAGIDRARLSVAVGGARDIFRRVNFLTSQNLVPVIEAEALLAMKAETLKAVLDLYLHSPLVSVPVEPFHSLVEGLAGKGAVDLWRAYDEVPEEHVYISRDGRASLSARWAARGRVYGRAGAGIAGWQTSAFWREVVEYRRGLFSRLESCAVCEVFALCGGLARFGEAGNGACVRLRGPLAELGRGVAQIRKELGEDDPGPGSPRPGAGLQATVFVETRCVNDCVFCAAADVRHSGRRDTAETIRGFIRRAARAGVESLSLSGAGEPTLNPDLADHVRLARSEGIRRVVIFTNGHGLDAELLGRLVSAGVGGFLVSLHGLERSHDAAVGRPGSFREALAAMDLIAAAGTELTVNTCVTRLNLKELRGIADTAAARNPVMHSLAFPEWNGNAPRNDELMCSYRELADELKSFPFAAYPHLALDNVPSCVANPKAPRTEDGTPILYHDPLVEHTVDRKMNLGRNVYLETCRLVDCPWMGKCQGVDPAYVASRGQAEFASLCADMDLGDQG